MTHPPASTAAPAPPPSPPRTARAVDELDLAADLPTGTVVLEASAGTGKTYAIAALATRAVAEGRCTLPELLIVSFTRAATAELRDRVRQRLVGAERHLRAVLAGAPAATADEDAVHACLADVPADELVVRRDRLATALTDFDAATISTIHGFTQQVLRSVGLSADVPRDLTLLEDESALLEEVVDDVYVRRYLGRAAEPARPSRRDVAAIARAVAANGDADLRPALDDPDPAGAERVALAYELRAELGARKRHDGTLGYDDLLLALRDALTDPIRGATAVAVLRSRYRWALIDEFQDTDPVQWDILDRAFRRDESDGTDDDRALVLIGDPKQAIYSFRGADVRAYLDATARADRQLELTTNFRSDGPLLGALDRMLTGTTFGEHDIRFVSVRPVDRHRHGALSDDADPAALQLRTYAPPHGQANTDAVRQRFGADVTAVLLDQLGRVRLGADDHLMRPEDVAVLVRTNDEARLVQRCLREARIPSVVNGVGSVLATDAADDWRWLLDATERPSDPARIRRLALSTWIGWDATDLGAASDDALDELHDTAQRWAQVLADHGVATLERTVLTDRGVAARTLATIGGERHLTDLRHVGELLHTAERDEDRGVSSLRSWLLTARADAGDTPTPSEEQARRLESDAAAVQILTVHRSKGLEYPVVLVPFHWGSGQGVSAPAVVHDPASGRRVIDVGPSGRPGFEAVKQVAEREQTGEMLRLLYVALTRARHRAIVWWVRNERTSVKSPLARTLFGHGPDGQVQLEGAVEVPKDAAEADSLLRDRFAGTATSIAAVPLPGDGTPGTWADDRDAGAELTAAPFDRQLDRAWRRTSYSAIVRRAEHAVDPTVADRPVAGVASEAEVTGTDDEPDTTGEVPGAIDDLTAAAGGVPDTTVGVPGAARGVSGVSSDLSGAALAGLSSGGRELPLGALRGGTAFGTMVHAVLEHTDFAAPDLPAHLDEVIATERPRHRVPGLTPVEVPTLRDGLVATVRSPLGPLAGRVEGRWRQLADLPRSARLDELDFELPLAGGDLGGRGGTSVTLTRLAELLDRPVADGGLADDDPVRRAGYADRLRTPGFALHLRGYLNGSIDLVLRVPAEDRDDDLGGDAIGNAGRDASGASGDRPGGGWRYLVADHKTNRLGGEVITTDDYHPDRLAAAMVDHDYPLQALLYQVALHRYLRWRVPGYDPDVHLGGALYLFLRGMVGPDTPTVDGAPHGVFAWNPPAAIVTGLSDLLDGAASAPQVDTEVLR